MKHNKLILDYDLISTYKPWAEKFEGVKNHFYLDPLANVTIGIGHFVLSVQKAEELTRVCTFLPHAHGKQASSAEVKEDYLRVRGEHKAELYITRASIAELFRVDMQHCLQQLRVSFPQFDTFPKFVKLALLDMIFNLGLTGMQRFACFVEAVAKQNWQIAAKESYRLGIQEIRNITVKNWFQTAQGK